MGSYKKIGLSHEMGLIDTPPLGKTVPQVLLKVCCGVETDLHLHYVFNTEGLRACLLPMATGQQQTVSGILFRLLLTTGTLSAGEF